jgi:cbb3-type cytochrome oxidase maturation protein
VSSLFILIPISLVFLLIAIIAWLWSVKSGQFNDLDQEASRILFDECEEALDHSDMDQESGNKRNSQKINGQGNSIPMINSQEINQ